MMKIVFSFFGFVPSLLNSSVCGFQLRNRGVRGQQRQHAPGVPALSAVKASSDSQLAQLASMTTLSIDSGDLKVIEEYAATGYITDATTNPLFVSQAGLSGDPVYGAMVDDAIEFTLQTMEDSEPNEAMVSLAMDWVAVNLGKAISDIIPGYISTEVDPRLSFDVEASVKRGR